MTVQWDKPIEAVHTDGWVVSASASEWEFPNHYVSGGDGIFGWPFNEDGRPIDPSPKLNGWTIRNVATPPADASTAPNGGEVGPEVVERMIALVRRLVALTSALDVQPFLGSEASSTEDDEMYAEARAIVALLPEPVDPDEAEAEAIWRSVGYSSLNVASDIRKVAVACLKRGRALEKEAGR